MKIASLSLRDYTDDLVRFVNSLDHPPLLIGHSMGGLLAQLVAARTRQASPSARRRFPCQPVSESSA
jgi:pimeloyl-ACP methyl ester carboxylesterase